MDSTRELLFEEFPHLLQNMPDPPDVLFIRGTLPSDTMKFLTIVGSRKYTAYGKEVCEMLVKSLRGLPVVIVSGLALGIDSIAHRAALECGLCTIAVPGSGLDENSLYPASHLRLAEEIVDKGGCLISLFPDGTRATNWMFPLRNRIMAGISHATLVIEAEKKSGTLITSKHATEFNRDVFTVPGSIFGKQSEGPHQLMQLGATPITCGKDLREALGFKVDETVSTRDYSGLSPDETILINLLDDPLSREELFSKALEKDMDVTRINIALSLLEIKEMITEKLGNIMKV